MNDFRLYVTDWAPNGTRDLIITDHHSQTIGIVSDAVFGGRLKRDIDDQPLTCDDTGVFVTDDNGVEILGEIFQVDMSFIKRHLAISPVQNELDILNQIDDIIEGS